MCSYTNQWGATPSHKNPHLFMDTGKHMEVFTGGRQSFIFDLSRISLEAVWMQKGPNEMKNQCHDPSSNPHHPLPPPVTHTFWVGICWITTLPSQSAWKMKT
ncbi:hypothetical protein E3U43_009077 [Larimichthys crocea]|uniref:Uncharacterized protein n=1 Tax=Larimichthys crocea TaxID=215358 RepID=A0ACD3RWD1_LARCR|nr:hypothetical protein E3U43_009077 [Larimichthys crocea]